jgi:hypothetical protein
MTMITVIIIVITIIFNVKLGEEHSGSAFLSNSHCGPTAETARPGCKAPSGLSRAHIFAFEFLLSSEQGTQKHTYMHTM